MLRYHVNVKDEILSSEIAMTTIEVCPICGKSSFSQSTNLCREHYHMFMDYVDATPESEIITIDSWINREISIRKSFPKHFV